MPTLLNSKKTLPWTIQIPYSELVEFKLFATYIAYVITQFDYDLFIEETPQYYEMSFKEEREAQRVITLFRIFRDNIKLDNTNTRKLDNEEFFIFVEWCYNNIESGWIIYEYSGMVNQQYNLFKLTQEVPIFVESEEEMVLLKLRWC